MSEIPDAMKQGTRHPVPHFDPNEYLYRRIPLDSWPDASVPIDINAMSLPDLSVGRSRFGHPEWLRLAEERFATWGVVGFRVSGIPSERWVLGVYHYTFDVQHRPERLNYPHSEVWCYENGVHVDAVDKLPEDMHIKWREMLLRNTEPFLKPHQSATIREATPVSYVPDLPIPS